MPIIMFASVIVSVLFQVISIIKKRNWILIPTFAFTIYFLFTRTIEIVLMSAIISTAFFIIFSNASRISCPKELTDQEEL